MQARRLWQNTASEEALGQLNRSSPNRKNTIFDSAQSAVGAYIGNESMPKIIINNTIDLFFLSAISILLIADHSSRVLFDKIASPYVLFEKILALEMAVSTVPIVSAHFR